jgi:hypothetical protein
MKVTVFLLTQVCCCFEVLQVLNQICISALEYILENCVLRQLDVFKEFGSFPIDIV